MPIELKKETLAQREVIIRTGCEAFADVDVIVPDVKPDVVRILQIDANPVIMDKTVHDEKLLFDCLLDICILYAAENGCVKSIRVQHSFSHQVNNKKIAKDLFAEAYCSLARLDYRIVNSRKLSVNATVAIDYCLLKEREIPFVTGFESDSCQALYTPVKFYVPAGQTVTELSVRETFDVPQGKPDADEILRMNVRLSNKDVRYAGSKAVVKGDLVCSALYVSDVEPSSLQTVEYAIPFTEVIDLPEMEEGSTCNIDFIYKSLNYSAKQDGDGDNRIIYVEAYMDAVASCGRVATVNTVSDAYSTDCDIELNYQPVIMEELVGDAQSRETVKSTASLPSGQPEIAAVYNVTASAGNCAAGADGKNVIVEGELHADVLYKTTDNDMPVNSFAHTMPFTCSFEMDGLDERTMFDVNVDVDNVSYNINMPDELELRCTVCVRITAIRSLTVQCITSLEQHELPESSSCGAYCIRIYFVRKGDTLWKIAKRYKVSLEKLMKVNNLTEESIIMPGQQLIIP